MPAELAAGGSSGPAARSAASAPVLSVRGLRKSFGGYQVLRNVECSLAAGRIVLLRGQNGSGKTTLINILTGNLEPDGGVLSLSAPGNVPREFSFPLRWWNSLQFRTGFAPENLARYGVGRSWQDIRLFSRQTVGDNLALARRNQAGENPFTRVIRFWHTRREESSNQAGVLEQLAGAGLAGRQEALVTNLSLGEAKQVAIERTLRAGARVIFLDEPVSGLDQADIARFISAIEQLVRNESASLVVVEHADNIPAVLGIASEVWTLANGEIAVESPEAVAAEMRNEQRDGLRRWLGDLGEGRLEEEILPAGGRLTVLRRGMPGAAPLLDAENLAVSRGQRKVIGWPALDGLSFRLHAGDIALLQAPNGWGKSTLLEALAGLLPVDRGNVRIAGSSPRFAYERARGGAALLRPRGTLLETLTIAENLELFGCTGIDVDIPQSRIVSSLSGGERQRVAWAVTLGRKSSVMLLDEPFLSLDARRIETLLARVAQQRDKAVLITAPRRREE